MEKKNINLREYIDNEKKRVEIYEEVEYSLEKVAIKYPDLKIDISTSRFTGIGTITNNLYVKINIYLN